MRNTVQGKDGFGLGDGFMKPGQELVMAGYTGFSGTLLMEKGRERFWGSILLRDFCAAWKKESVFPQNNG